MQAKRKAKLREQEELFNEIDQVSLFIEKRKVRKAPSEELVEKSKRELDNVSSLKDEVVQPSKKKKKVELLGIFVGIYVLKLAVCS